KKPCDPQLSSVGRLHVSSLVLVPPAIVIVLSHVVNVNHHSLQESPVPSNAPETRRCTTPPARQRRFLRPHPPAPPPSSLPPPPRPSSPCPACPPSRPSPPSSPATRALSSLHRPPAQLASLSCAFWPLHAALC